MTTFACDLDIATIYFRLDTTRSYRHKRMPRPLRVLEELTIELPGTTMVKTFVSRAVVLAGFAAAASVFAGELPVEGLGGITDFGPPPYFQPLTEGITSGADGNLWFAIHFGHAVGKITTAGEITEYYPTLGYPHSVTRGPDGNIWFVDQIYNQQTQSWDDSYIGKITPDGYRTEYGPTGLGEKSEWTAGTITAGPDGNVWFTGYSLAKGTAEIGRVTLDGEITLFPLSHATGGAPAITSGPDGRIWFTTFDFPTYGSWVGSITTDGEIAQYGPVYGWGRAIITGPDGNMWFVADGGQVCSMSTAGILLNCMSTAGRPWGITVGPDGAIWFTDSRLDDQGDPSASIARISDTGDIQNFGPIPAAWAASLVTGPDGNLWFNDLLGGKIYRVRIDATTVLPAALSHSGTFAHVSLYGEDPERYDYVRGDLGRPEARTFVLDTLDGIAEARGKIAGTGLEAGAWAGGNDADPAYHAPGVANARGLAFKSYYNISDSQQTLHLNAVLDGEVTFGDVGPSTGALVAQIYAFDTDAFDATLDQSGHPPGTWLFSGDKLDPNDGGYPGTRSSIDQLFDASTLLVTGTKTVDAFVEHPMPAGCAHDPPGSLGPIECSYRVSTPAFTVAPHQKVTVLFDVWAASIGSSVQFLDTLSAAPTMFSDEDGKAVPSMQPLATRCGQPVSGATHGAPVTSDALALLRAAVGLATTCPATPCLCDVDANGKTTTADALLVLRLAVGLDGSLACSCS